MVSDSSAERSITSETTGAQEPNAYSSPFRREEPLAAVLGIGDMTVLMVLIVLFVANNNGVQLAGPAAFFYWGLGLLTFLLPCAYVTRWLALRFPGQGAPYLWATKILGERWSFFSAYAAWLPGVLVIVAAIQSSLIFVQYLAPNWFTTPIQQGVAIILILIVPTAVACVPLRLLKRILLVLALFYVGVFVLLGVAGILWIYRGHVTATAFTTAGAWMPNKNNFAAYGVVILAYLGVDVPLFMGGEIRDGKAGVRRATTYVWWGTAIVFLAYVLGTFGVMAIVPAAQSGGMSANVIAISMVFGPVAGKVADIVLAIGQVALTIAYILTFSRLLVVVAQDKKLPAALTKLNRRGVPVNSIIAQSSLAAVITILSLVILPVLFGSQMQPNDLANAIYTVLQASTTVIWVCTVIQLFVFVFWLLYRRKNHLITSRRQRWLLLLSATIGCAASLIGIWGTVSSSWLPTLIPNENWTIIILGVTILSFLVGLVGSELPRLHALVSEQTLLTTSEKKLRAQLQEAYMEQQDVYNEQQILVQQQQELLSEVDRLYREQAEAAITDAVTGLPNHRAIIARLDDELARSQRTERSCAVLFVDLDHFKRINDTWGHQAGDAILREVGQRLRTNIRQQDFVGRYGGEEFAIVLTEVDIIQAVSVAEKLCFAIADQPCLWMQNDAVEPISVTGSFGVAVYQLHGNNREELIAHADNGMYLAKQAGRNCVRVGDVEIVVTGELAATRESTVAVVVPVQVIQAFVAMAGAHDRSTGEHAYRLMRLVEATARKLEYPEEQMHIVRLGALLHDIGKIGVPDAILRKPGKLSDEEWVEMRKHPEIGRQIVDQVGGAFAHISNIIAAHHERWDGFGYPNGLSGEDIPLGARIITVVDAYDAMTERRVYRDPLPDEAARVELLRCAGQQFDSRVVEAFLAVLDDQHALRSSEQGIEASTEVETANL
jgi:diguanylate cyclase (GGDEF)-like protein/putative nucleotidyltransferase with HDIG domain